MQDYRFAREEWAALKPQMPFGQVPVLEVDGKYLAQSKAIEMYAARLTGLYPTDTWEAAQVRPHDWACKGPGRGLTWSASAGVRSWWTSH